MNERSFSLILGLSLLSIIYFDFVQGMYALVGLMLFEGITNWRIPLLVTRLRYSQSNSYEPGDQPKYFVKQKKGQHDYS